MLRTLLALSPFFAPASSAFGQESEPAVDRFVAFATALEESTRAWDPSFLEENFDFDAFMLTVTRDIEVEDVFRRAFSEAVRDNFSFGEVVVQNLTQFDGTYVFLRMLPGEPPRALFRFAGDDGLNYHELHLRERSDGRISIVDVFAYNTGEMLSETMRRPYVATASDQNRSLVSRLLRPEAAYVEALPRIEALIRLQQTGKPKKALAIYRSLPEEVRLQPEILALYLEIAFDVDDATYLKALAVYSEAHPDSPALDLLMIDFHLLRGEYEQCLARIDALDRRVLMDPYLDLYRGNVLLDAGRKKEARAKYEAAIERDPRLEYEAWWFLLGLAVLEEDHAATLELLLALESDYGVEMLDLESVEEYAKFVASPEYQRWLELHLEEEPDQG